MKWGEGDRWTLTMDLPPGKHEFKVGGLEWYPSCTMFGAAARVLLPFRHVGGFAAAHGGGVPHAACQRGLCIHRCAVPTASGSPPITLQVAVAQGDSLVHYEDGPNRTLQVWPLSSYGV